MYTSTLQTMQSKVSQNTELAKLLKDESYANFPRPGDLIKGTVISLAKNEIRVDVGGLYTGVIRGRETIDESRELPELKMGDEIEATVLEQENENGELVTGCGMDMTFWLADRITYELGYKNRKHLHGNGGSCLAWRTL